MPDANAPAAPVSPVVFSSRIAVISFVMLFVMLRHNPAFMLRFPFSLFPEEKPFAWLVSGFVRYLAPCPA
jgi:hypothetical protein